MRCYVWLMQRCADNQTLFYLFQLVNVFKLLKTLHRKPKDASYVEPLPPDLWLQFEVILDFFKTAYQKICLVFSPLFSNLT